ncbi:Tfiih basal transcription factor complex p44 subunit, partial [Daphnia magna]
RYFCPALPRLTKWQPDSTPIAFSRGGVVNPIMANRGRSLDISLCFSLCVNNLDVTEESWNGLLKKVLQNQISIATVIGVIPYRAVKYPALRIFHKCENLICVQVGLLRLQRLMEKPFSSR